MKKRTETLEGRVISLEPATRPGFHLRTGLGPVYCLVASARVVLPSPGTTVRVTGRESRAIVGYFDVLKVEIIGESPRAA